MFDFMPQTTVQETEPQRILREARQGIVPKGGALKDAAARMMPIQRLGFLSDFLRTPAAAEFWDFRSPFCDPGCGTAGCAIGWWDHITSRRCFSSKYGDEFGVNNNAASAIFFKTATYGKAQMGSVTPTDVADAIDGLLHERAS
jgi:hypothetical protein